MIAIKEESIKKKKQTNDVTPPKKKQLVQIKLTALKLTEKKSSNKTILAINNIKGSRKQFLTLKPSAIFSELCKFDDKPENMISAMERNIINGFALKYDIKPKIQTRNLR